MLLSTESGEYRLATFIKPELMSRLYEKFILEYYNQEHEELDARASQIPWGLDDGVDTMLPVMQTDITLTQGDKILIIDAKYYSSTLQQHYDRMTVHSNNLYQIFTYVKNKEVELKVERESDRGTHAGPEHGVCRNPETTGRDCGKVLYAYEGNQ